MMTCVPATRLVRSLLFALAAFLLLGGGIGFAAAADKAAQADTLRVPLPSPGDAATYRTSNLVLDEKTAIDWKPMLSRISYVWLPERRMMDADFGSRLVQPMRTEFAFPGITYVQEASYDAATGQPLAQRWINHYESNSGTFLSLNGFSPLGTITSRLDSTFDALDGQIGPCGVRNALQGTEFRNGTIEMPGFCDWRWGRSMTHFAAMGWETVNGRHAMRFEGVEDHRVQVWYASGIPFPVQAIMPESEIIAPDYAKGRAFRIELQDLQLGEGSYAPLAAPDTRDPIGALPLAPRTDWGLDESGMDWPFTLEEAYKVMLAEGSRPGLSGQTASEYMSSHPGAYLGNAWFGRTVDGNGAVHEAWWFIVTDGHTHVNKRVAREPFSPYGGVYLPAQAGAYDQVTSYATTGLRDDVTGFFPTPDRLPSALPLPAPLLAAYTHATGSTANTFGFRIFCSYAAGCARTDVYVGAGFADETSTSGATDPTALQGSSWKEDLALAGVAGHLTGWQTVSGSRDGLLGGGAPPASPAPATQGTLAAKQVWVLPSAPAAAGVGLFALLAGALYYFWPALKGLPVFGLFSRIEKGRVAEHPQRARILELVAAEPGIHHKEISRRLGIGQGALDHHARKLEQAGEIVRRANHGYTCYFLKLGTDRHLIAASPVVKSKGGRAVLQAVAARPDATFRVLADEAGVAPSTVEHHLKRLREAGLVEPATVGLRLSPVGEKVRAGL